MLKNLIILPDGTEIFSGAGEVNAIQSVSVTEHVNIGDELYIGSAYANKLKATIIAPEGGLSLTDGDDVTLYKVDDAGTRTQIGVYTLEKPTRPTANTMKLTGYDHVAKLDKNLTEWLKSLDGWPYNLLTFAGMVCAACGLAFVESDVPNSDFPVQQFSKSGVTGRQIMRWLGEICCRFVRATADGNIEFGWYTPAEKSITPTGDPYIIAGGLSYETYQVAPVDAVQIQLADSSSGALWPAADEGANAYIITGNTILLSHVTDDLLPYLENIRAELGTMTYTPCKVSVPANLDIKAGSIVNITDKNGNTITAYVMTKTTSGQRDTLECTGSPRRDSSTALYNKTDGQKATAAENAAQQAVNGQTQEDIFNKLTNNGELQGLYIQDGKLYINAEFVKILNLIVDHVLSEAGESKLEITGALLKMLYGDKSTVQLSNEFGGLPILYMSDYKDGVNTDNSELSPHHLKIGGTSTVPVFAIEVSDGLSSMQVDTINPTGNGNCCWEYIPSIGKYVLVKGGTQ